MKSKPYSNVGKSLADKTNLDLVQYCLFTVKEIQIGMHEDGVEEIGMKRDNRTLLEFVWTTRLVQWQTSSIITMVHSNLFQIITHWVVLNVHHNVSQFVSPSLSFLLLSL